MTAGGTVHCTVGTRSPFWRIERYPIHLTIDHPRRKWNCLSLYCRTVQSLPTTTTTTRIAELWMPLILAAAAATRECRQFLHGVTTVFSTGNSCMPGRSLSKADLRPLGNILCLFVCAGTVSDTVHLDHTFTRTPNKSIESIRVSRLSRGDTARMNDSWSISVTSK